MPSSLTTMIEQTRLVSLAYVHHLMPIKSWDDVLGLAEDAGIAPDDACWALDRVQIADMFTVEVEDQDEALAAMTEAVENGDTPPLLLVHSPNHYGSGQNHLLWDGAHRRTVAMRLGIGHYLSWVGHMGSCCYLANPFDDPDPQP